MPFDWKADFVPLTDDKQTKLTTKTARNVNLRLRLTHLRVKLDEAKMASTELQTKIEELLEKIKALEEERNSLLEKVHVSLCLKSGTEEALQHMRKRNEKIQSQRIDEKIVAHGAFQKFKNLIEQLKEKNLLHLIDFEEI